MDTSKLKAFIEICKSGSFSKASEQFSYTPSAFSHMIDGLEKDFGVQLFDRSHKGVCLTKQGEQLYNDIVRVVDAENLLNAKLARIKCENDIKITTYSSIAHFILPGIMRDYKKINDKVKFSIKITDCLKDEISSDNSDVYFGDALNSTDQIEYLPILKDEYVAVVPSSEFKGRRSVKWEELYPYPFIKTNETILNKTFKDESFKEIVNYTSVEDFSILTMVAENIGVSITNALVARERVNGVRVLKLVPELYRNIGVMYKKNVSPEVKKFINYLKEKYKK